MAQGEEVGKEVAAVLSCKGIVESALPQGLYRVRTEAGVIVTAALSALAKQTIVRVIPGDQVILEVSPLDPSRGRIKVRLP